MKYKKLWRKMSSTIRAKIKILGEEQIGRTSFDFDDSAMNKKLTQLDCSAAAEVKTSSLS